MYHNRMEPIRILITGFDPIWGIKKTPSGELAKQWKSGALQISGVATKALVLPQVFGKSTEIVCGEIQSWQPHVVLMFGATQKNDPIRLERFAINVERTPMGDNTRIPVQDRPVVRGGPPAYESNLPIGYLIDTLESSDINAKASYFAGTHVCNSILYGVMHWLAHNPTSSPTVAGFIHVSFPNEYGVIEDEHWTTSSFQGIIQASIVLISACAKWYIDAYERK